MSGLFYIPLKTISWYLKLLNQRCVVDTQRKFEMPIPKSIQDLVKQFEQNKESYVSTYNETQLRIEFINPFFKILGWDIDNTQGHSESYKEVIHEDRIKIGDNTKAPDYCFMFGGVRKFFVEAKKPSVNIKDSFEPAYQLRRYAWSAKLPLSILTNFAEFAVYDCRIKPSVTDKASTARIFYCDYTEYETRWDEISQIFARDSIPQGLFDRYAQSAASKKGSTEVDEVFLKEMSQWREMLALNIALRNSDVTSQDLNFLVTMTINRIIFLRICEDRGIEPYGQLKMKIESEKGKNIYQKLYKLFMQTDSKYNSGLFHFRKEKGRINFDDVSPRIIIDDQVLINIIKNLYYPDSPYVFYAFPSDILGQVYEQFLGKVIRLTPSHRAVVEDKPEVKKAGGVYYTPTYIVEYIVRNTIGTLCENKTPDEVAKLRVLDPACGSGSFLIQAYQYLLDWHLHYYLNHSPKKWSHGKSPLLFKTKQDEWQLTTTERKRILLNNIYGVDIDSQAVEVTKLSLLLKVLEGENEQTWMQQFEMLQERVLPDLDRNITCGNSLISYDCFTQEIMTDNEEKERVNAFDWNHEFSEIMKSGGFDAVIGNPPYIRIQTMKEWAPLEVEMYKEKYISARKGNYDIYVVFVEKGLSLLKKSGLLGFILPHKFFNSQYGEALRTIIAQGKHLHHVVHFGDQQVFAHATTYTCMFFLNKSRSDQCQVIKVNDLNAWRDNGKSVTGTITAESITSAEWNFVVGKSAKLFEKLRKMPTKLADVATKMYQGVITSADTVYLFKDYHASKKKGVTDVFSTKIAEWVSLESNILKRVIRSGSIHRYSADHTAQVLFPYEVKDNLARLYTPREMEHYYPMAWDYLNRNKKFLICRENKNFKDSEWYRFGRSQNLGMWEQPKLMIPYMITDLAAYPDSNNNYYFVNVTTGGYGITIDSQKASYEYICGLLNSQLLDFFLKQVSTRFQNGYFAANKQYIEQLPIRLIDFSDSEDKAKHDRMVILVDRMIVLHKQKLEAKTPYNKERIDREIAHTDQEIDDLVYNLYELNKNEIQIIGSE